MADLGRRSALHVAAGAAVAALSGVVVFAISARVLPTEQNTAFLTYWAALFAIFAVISGVQSEVTRAVRADLLLPPEHARATPPVAVALLVGVVVGLIVAALYPVWAVVFVGDSALTLSVALMALAAASYTGHVATVGALAGHARWGAFASLTATEALVRLVLVLLAAGFGWGMIGFETAAAGGALTWVLATLLLPRFRIAWRARVSIRPAALIGRMTNAMTAAGANALLVTGFPLLMSATTGAAEYATAAPLVVAVSMTRAPLLIPITAFQSMVIASFVQHPERARSSLLKLVCAVIAVAVIGGVMAGLLGPWIMSLVFGASYGNSALVLGMLVAAASFLALLVLGGAIALALDRHTVNTLGWYAALAVSIALMLTPFALETRTILALLVGPMVGSAVHFTAILGSLRPGRAAAV